MGFWSALKSFFGLEEYEETRPKTPEIKKDIKKNGTFIFNDMNLEFDIPENLEVKNIQKVPGNIYIIDAVGVHGGNIRIKLMKITDEAFNNMTKQVGGRRIESKDFTKENIKYISFRDEEWTSPGFSVSHVNTLVKINNSLLGVYYTEDGINSFYDNEYKLEAWAYANDDSYTPPPYSPPNQKDLKKECECLSASRHIEKSVKWID